MVFVLAVFITFLFAVCVWGLQICVETAQGNDKIFPCVLMVSSMLVYFGTLIIIFSGEIIAK